MMQLSSNTVKINDEANQDITQLHFDVSSQFSVLCWTKYKKPSNLMIEFSKKKLLFKPVIN